MHLTLHLTNNCNMNCSYCYVDRNNIRSMSLETAKKAVDMAVRITPEKDSIGIIFFGGEPLLHKDMIYETIKYANSIEKRSDRYFHYKVTTNGLLLDDEFLDFSNENNLFIAISMDGDKTAHDMHRTDISGAGTHSRIASNAIKTLAIKPYTPVLMTINPDTASFYADSVKYLFDLGFRYVISSLNYAADWDDADISELEKQYKILADLYYKMTIREEKFYLSPFEVKLSSHINQKTYCHERCELGKKQISISPEGLAFPCVQFVGDNHYSIGDVDNGIDEGKREFLYRRNEKEKDTCVDCAVRDRCNHYCGCMNKQSTGSMDKVSPVQCAHERLLLPIADRLGEKLFKKRNAMFIQKNYNEFFPIVSMVEDRAK